MYIILAFVMLFRGFSDAVMMRAQQALASGANEGFLPPHHYDQVFTAHGVIMIFFVAMPFVVGLMNFAVPLQIGARDVAFPYLNSLSFWLTVAGAVLINLSLGIGEFAKTGWLAYPPLSGKEFSPDVGVDYYIWALQISGMGTLLSGVNLITTIIKMRAPGMGMMQVPVFTWTALCSNVLIVAAFPILTVTLALLSLDRYLDFHFFTNDAGGNPMMYVNLIWIWGHPEVYILILPAFGVFSEIIATFSGKRLFGYKSMVYATVAITVLSFLVWVHHFFTMGGGANVNAFFGVATMIISIPTGAKVFNWLFTMYKGRVRMETPVLWTIGFMCTFVVGGMTGVLLAVPPADFVLHNSVFLIAHFHNVIISGVLFGCFAGLVAEGFRLQAERTSGPQRILVLAGRLHHGLHAALRARPDGHDPSSEPHRKSGMAHLSDHRRRRRCDHPVRYRVPGSADRSFDPRPRKAARQQWRQLGYGPYAGMVAGFAACILQLR
jgi:cytochrome o ubiquinol oxidase subunit I